MQTSRGKLKELESRIAYLELEQEGVYKPYPESSDANNQYENMVKAKRRALYHLNTPPKQEGEKKGVSNADQ